MNRRSYLPGLLSAVILGAAAATALAQADLAEQRSARVLSEPSPADGQAAAQTVAIPVLDLLVRGGWLMLPIGLMSVVVVALGVERALALRRSRILPAPLAASLEEMADRQPTDPLSLRRLCERFPSSAARVIEAVLHKLGRPMSELERSVSEAAQREADRMYTNVRTLNLASTITPLLGLLGTVWGMIQAFIATANMPIGSSKGQALAEGIYVALVTTFAGLSVAIPAAVLAHLFESRILRLMRDVEQLVGGLLPQLERGTAKLRIDEPHEEPSPMTTPRPTVRRDAKAS
jgi:biopolymer transport protein ExbB